ncbi:MAG: PadR family transcriptional regulator [Candidatus Bathyarchaeia archaeon]
MASKSPESSAYTRLVNKITKENLWLYILKMLIDRPMYAYEISKSMKDKFGFSTAVVTVYVVLYKMRREELIQVGEEKSVLGRPDRKYYEITEEGRSSLQDGIKFLEGVVSKLT